MFKNLLVLEPPCSVYKVVDTRRQLISTVIEVATTGKNPSANGSQITRLDAPGGECYPSPTMKGKRFLGFFFMQPTRAVFAQERGSA
jgi:hypothetical protein